VLLDPEQARRPVAEVAGEEDPHNPVAVVMGGAPEQRIDGGAVTVLLRSPGETYPAALQKQLAVGGRDVDPTGLDGGASWPAWAAGSDPARFRMRGSALVTDPGKCTTTKTAAGKS
jgi:hypothetical protein